MTRERIALLVLLKQRRALVVRDIPHAYFCRRTSLQLDALDQRIELIMESSEKEKAAREGRISERPREANQQDAS